jgi:hypothetical protein
MAAAAAEKRANLLIMRLLKRTLIITPLKRPPRIPAVFRKFAPKSATGLTIAVIAQ